MYQRAILTLHLGPGAANDPVFSPVLECGRALNITKYNTGGHRSYIAHADVGFGEEPQDWSRGTASVDQRSGGNKYGTMEYNI